MTIFATQVEALVARVASGGRATVSQIVLEAGAVSDSIVLTTQNNLLVLSINADDSNTLVSQSNLQVVTADSSALRITQACMEVATNATANSGSILVSQVTVQVLMFNKQTFFAQPTIFIP